jgi:VanZ family protein
MSPRFKNVTLHWLPLIAYCALIYLQSAYPAPEKLPSFILMDKMLHFLAYALMGILFYRAYLTLPYRPHRQLLIVLSMVSASLYGISDEIHQHFVPSRNADMLDVVADTIGAVCGVYLYQLWARQHEPAG